MMLCYGCTYSIYSLHIKFDIAPPYSIHNCRISALLNTIGTASGCSNYYINLKTEDYKKVNESLLTYVLLNK